MTLTAMAFPHPDCRTTLLEHRLSRPRILPHLERLLLPAYPLRHSWFSLPPAPTGCSLRPPGPSLPLHRDCGGCHLHTDQVPLVLPGFVLSIALVGPSLLLHRDCGVHLHSLPWIGIPLSPMPCLA